MWLDGSTSYATPPTGITADPSQYGLFGGRLRADFDWGGAAASGRWGQAFSGSDGRWVQGDVSLSSGVRAGPGGFRLTVSGFGLGYTGSTFDYDAGGVDLRPTLAYPIGAFVVSAATRFTRGRWTTGTLAGDLAVAGGDLEVQRTFGATRLVVSAGALNVDNGVTAGTFLQADGQLVVDKGGWSFAAGIEAQETPLERELGGSVRASVSLAPGVDLQAYVGRRVRDPLFGTPGSFGFSLGATVRAIRWSVPEPPPVVQVGEAADAGRRVHFAIRAPEAETVALNGDFTGWDPVPMERSEDGWWRVTRVLGAGVHHFGFLVDGEWAIPPDAPGVVEDGWGRENASVVVEP